MPEFEETKANADSAQTYSPGDEAKPRTRRRSGGFKKDYAEAPKGNMGEIDPVKAFQTETLSGGDKPAAQSVPVSSDEPQVIEPPVERRQTERREREADTPAGNPQPDEATLAAVKRVEERIAKRKAERDARHEARKKSAPERPAAKAPGNKANTGNRKAPAQGGLIASILKLFGLGPKPAPKPAGRGRPPAKRGERRDGPRNDGGQRRRSRGGRGRRRGGRGGDRGQPARSRDNS